MTFTDLIMNNRKLTGILLAAGTGSRLGEMTIKVPKALIKVSQRPLIDYAINFLKRVGVDEIKVIGGAKYHLIRDYVDSLNDKMVKLYRNRHFKKGNLYSMAAVLNEVENDFLLMNIDHIYHKKITQKIKEQFGRNIVAYTDYDRPLGSDDMKVFVDTEEKTLKRISKGLRKYSLGYVGVTFCPQNCLKQYKEAFEEAKRLFGGKAVVENVLQILANNGSIVKIGDISGSKWFEIDYPNELQRTIHGISGSLEDYL